MSTLVAPIKDANYWLNEAMLWLDMAIEEEVRIRNAKRLDITNTQKYRQFMFAYHSRVALSLVASGDREGASKYRFLVRGEMGRCCYCIGAGAPSYGCKCQCHNRAN